MGVPGGYLAWNQVFLPSLVAADPGEEGLGPDDSGPLHQEGVPGIQGRVGFGGRRIILRIPDSRSGSGADQLDVDFSREDAAVREKLHCGRLNFGLDRQEEEENGTDPFHHSTHAFGVALSGNAHANCRNCFILITVTIHIFLRTICANTFRFICLDFNLINFTGIRIHLCRAMHHSKRPSLAFRWEDFPGKKNGDPTA
jgi:hypothetical protein